MPRPDPSEGGGRRRYRDTPSFGGDKKPGGGFSGAGDGSPTTRGNKPASGGGPRAQSTPEGNQNQNTPGQSPTINTHSGKNGDRDNKKEQSFAKAATSKAVDKGLDAVQKKGSGTIVGEAAGLAKTLKHNHESNDSAGVKAADTAAAAVRAGAAATGVGGAVVKGWDGAKKAASLVGIKIKDRYVIYALLFQSLFLMSIIVLGFYIVIANFENAAKPLETAFNTVKNVIGVGIDLLISQGGAQKLAYEVPVNSNSAFAAPAAPPANLDVSSYAYKLSQIDWEKAKYQTQKTPDNCVVKTQEVINPTNGKKRSVIESVSLKNAPNEAISDIAKASCMDGTYPVFNTIIRSQFIREGINANIGVRLAYAKPKDSKEFDNKTSKQITEKLRNKTLSRVWKSSGSGVNGYSDEQKKPMPIKCGSPLLEFFGAGCLFNNNFYAYPVTKDQPKEVVDCANGYDFTKPSNIDSAIDKANHDLECGVKPENLEFYYNLPRESDLTSSDSGIKSRAEAFALHAICEIHTRMTDKSQAAIDKYKKTVKDRLASQANSALHTITYAHTNRDHFLDIREINTDIYKIYSMVNAREYQKDVNNQETGRALESDAISRTFGLPNRAGANLYNDKALQAGSQLLNLFDIGSGQICNTFILDDDFFRKLINNQLPPSVIADFQTLSNTYYNIYKSAVGTIDFYSKYQGGARLSPLEAGKKVKMEDLLRRAVRIESNTSTAGIETDVGQNYNRSGVGIKAYKNALSLSMGGQFLTTNQAVASENEARSIVAYQDSQRGILWRLFSSANPRSIASRMAVTLIDRPDRVGSNVASFASDLFSPAKNLVGGQASLAYSLTGKSQVAYAATSYEIENLRIDPSAVPKEFKLINAQQNAIEIENLKKQPANAARFAKWDECFSEFIPSRFHLFNPDADKKDLYDNYCRQIFDIAATKDPKNISFKYRAYHYFMLQADAMVSLSNPSKEDPSLNASFSAADNTAVDGDREDLPTGPVAQPGSDTSALSCPPGTTDAGVGDRKNESGSVLYKIRLCRVGGITVNVSIAANLRSLLNQAKIDGINFGGGGYRSYDEQQKIRVKNGCSSPSLPSSACTPPTAKPGTSNHESGEAIDFSVGGRSIRSKGSKEFLWLTANASKYGLQNFPKEAWHWSVNGR